MTQQQETGLQKAQPTASERFMNAVLKEFTGSVGEVGQLTNFQRKIIQNYFIKLDMNLKVAEQKRLQKRDADPVEVTWANVNMQQLALDVISFSAIGLDPLQKNHINLIPYKNNGTGKYDITFIMGYDGIELKASKYGYDIPDDVIIELVYSKDKFKIHKKSKDNQIESYDFEVVDAFDRGEIVGGFWFHVFHETPQKNKLREYTKAQIDKRKPKYASAEFWGGEKAVYKDGKKVGVEEVEGWYEEMAWKTLKRAAYDAITIDSEKIDEHYLKALQAEREMDSDYVTLGVKAEIQKNANKQEITFEDAQIVEEASQELPSATEKVAPVVNQSEVAGVAEKPKNSKPSAANSGIQPSIDFD